MRATFASLALIVLAVVSCSSSEDVATAEREVQSFHEAFNAGQFDKIWDGAAEDLKKGSGKEEFVGLLQTVDRKLGKTTAGKRENWTVNYGTGGTTVKLVFETSFAKGKGTETFAYRISGKKALLVGYNLNSKNLLL